MGKPAARVAIVMGSESDLTVMREAARALEEMNVAFEVDVVSAHRTPEKLFEFSKGARKRGLSVIIAGAGGAAHLPGMIASLTELPVIGVPVPVGALQGQDALFSIVQMPAGVPVATVAIGGAYNAGILAAQILGSGGRQADEPLLDRIKKFKAHLGRKVIKSSVSVRRKSK